MEYSASSNNSSDFEGFRNLSSRSSTAPFVMDRRHPANCANAIDSLRATSTMCYESAPRQFLSGSYPSPNELKTNVPSNLNVSSLEVGNHANTSTFLEEAEGNICYEPDTVDAYDTVPNVTNFNPLLPEFSPLNGSLQAISSANDNYCVDFAAWSSVTVPWHETSESSVRATSDSQSRYQGTPMDKNKMDGQSQSQRNRRQTLPDPTVQCQEMGCGISFSRTGDLRRHLREFHDPEQKRLLCGCCNFKPNGFKREEKLINHKVKLHKFTRGSKLRTCLECHEANTLEVLYFCSADSLERHRGLVHGINSVENVPTGHNNNQHGPIKVTRTQSLRKFTEMDKMLPESSSSGCAKRGHQIEKEGTAKRAKLEREVHENTGKRAEIVSNKFSPKDPDSYTDLVNVGNEIKSAAAEEILVSDVGISDFFALSKNEVIHAIEKNLELDKADGLAKPEISFNAFERSIRLRGFGNITGALKAIIDEFLGKRQRPSLNGLTSLNLLCMRSKLPEAPLPRAETGTKIFAMRHVEDAELLKVWHERIIPSLPDLLAKFIGDDYSATLVRKGISESSGTAVIQIQSHTVLSKTVQGLIRNQIVRWVENDISLRGKQVQFLKGRLTTLSGEVHSIHDVCDSPEKDDGSDDDDEPECYPYYKRYWRTPGPGASIGLLCTKSIAATIGCYVNVEGSLFILTVKHFIDKSYDSRLTGASDETTVVSPALADVDDMREKLTQYVINFKIELDEAMKEHFGDQYPDYVPSIGSLPDHMQDIMAKLDVVQKDLSHLTQGDQLFKLGSLTYQSTIPSNSDCPLLSVPEQRFGHHMDWALCSVLAQRVGTNRHRYQYDHEEGVVDFYTGETDTFGAGQPFLGTCFVEANTKAHFVGQGTGRQSGEINAARILVRHKGVISEEWAMVMLPNRRGGNNMIHRGDSGASIVRDSDNKLFGLLWACTGDGQLVFTPINVVFDDIRQKVPAEVSLARMDPSSPPAMPLSTTVHEVDTICRDKTTEKPKLRRQFRSSDMPSPRRKQGLASSMPERVPSVITQPLVRKAVSPPTVLLGSTRSNIFKSPNTTFGPVLHAQICLAQQVFGALEDVENRHSLKFILNGHSAKRIGKRSTFPPTQGRVLNRTSTWPVKTRRSLDSRNAGAFNAISVN